MSDTPRTDAVDAIADQNYGVDVYRNLLEHARQLEREVDYWRGKHDGTVEAWKYSLKKTPQPITLFLCGPTKCEHDYSLWRELDNGGTAVCAKCGTEAIAEAAWL
jgi:hypothetical protein